jgi:integrase
MKQTRNGNAPPEWKILSANPMGSLYKRRGSKKWMMAATAGGRQVCKSSHTTNRRLAEKLLARWETEIFEGRFQLIKRNAPFFEEWAEQFLQTIPNLKTRSRYTSSVNNLKPRLGKLRLSQITADCIEDFKEQRLAAGVGPATVNRDLVPLRKMLRVAQKRRLIARSPFVDVESLEEKSIRPKPHIATYSEEERILEVAEPHIRALAVLILEAGLRSNCEALVLKWADIDFESATIRVRASKTPAGITNVPVSGRCKAELVAWRNRVGPESSPYVFPNMRDPARPLKDIRRSWAKALKLAGIPYFWIYNLRHTHASRLSAAGVPDLFVAQLIGHSSTSIVQTYAKAIDEYKRDAIRKLESLRPNPPLSVSPSPSPLGQTNVRID